MKQLLLMRHGASVRSGRGFEDRERPLNKRGKEDVHRIGAVARADGVELDSVLCSTALRARETALVVANECGYDGEILYLPELYSGGVNDYVAALRSLSEDPSRVLVVGHNPAIDDAVTALGGISKDMQTASLAVLHLVIDDWQQLHPAAPGTIRSLWRPRDLPTMAVPAEVVI